MEFFSEQAFASAQKGGEVALFDFESFENLPKLQMTEIWDFLSLNPAKPEFRSQSIEDPVPGLKSVRQSSVKIKDDRFPHSLPS